MATLGDRLRIAREARGLTQKELAREVKVPITHGTISHLESGRNENSRYVVWLAAALNVRAEWLCTGNGQMFDMWPWDDISSKQVATLPSEVIENIGRYIRTELANEQAATGAKADQDT